MDPKVQEKLDEMQRQLDTLRTDLMQHSNDGHMGEEVDIKHIASLFEVVTTAPTHTPRNVFEQVKIHYNSTGPVWKLYLYDYVQRVWKNVTIS